jgi:hypothetical protein
VAPQIVAIQRDIERAGRHLVTVDVVNRPGNPPRQRHAAGPDADHRQIIEAAVALENLVGNAGQRPAHAIGIHYHRHGDTSN